jgi:hypothetical protein
MSGSESTTASNSIFDSIVRVGERFGVPVMILAVFIWMARELATSLHGTVVMPLVKSHTEYLDSTRETLGEIANTQMSQAETLKELTIIQSEIKSAVMDRDAKEEQ